MRAFAFVAPIVLLLACGGKNDDPESGGHVEGGGAGSNGGSTSTGGSTSSSTGGGSETGGTNASGGSMNAAGAATPGNGGQAGGGELVSCTLSNVVCKSLAPSCPDNQVASVNGVCWGPCVPIESCACSGATDCPFNDRYTCWQKTHCGPYVK